MSTKPYNSHLDPLSIAPSFEKGEYPVDYKPTVKTREYESAYAQESSAHDAELPRSMVINQGRSLLEILRRQQARYNDI